MKTATVSEFRAKMKEHLDEVEKDQDILVLSGPRKKEFVLITLEQFNAMEETAHLLSTPANTQHLMTSIGQDKAGQVLVRDINSLSGKSVYKPKKYLVKKMRKVSKRK